MATSNWLLQKADYWAMVCRDALELLKGQEPRVLTKAEVKALPSSEDNMSPVVQEIRTPVGKWDGGTHCKWYGAGFVKEEARTHEWFNWESYGTIWRCWTAWPTEEKRKAVKWNG